MKSYAEVEKEHHKIKKGDSPKLKKLRKADAKVDKELDKASKKKGGKKGH